MQMNEREIIIDHVLENKENLGMALDIISMTQEIREQIIQSFLGKLKKVICEELDMSQWSWETGLCDNPYGANYLSFGVSRKFAVLKNEPVYIILQKQAKDLSNHIIGVGSDPESNALMQHLNCKLDEELGKGKRSKWWIWCQPLKSPPWKPPYWNYTDWTNKDTLIKMHTETDRVVKDIGNHLLRIIEVAKHEIEK